MIAWPGPLGNITRFVTPPSENGVGGDRNTCYSAARVRRYELQSVARDLLQGERVAICLRRLGFGKHSVEIWVSHEFHKAHIKGCVVCGSVWICPVCAARITERRRLELTNALVMARQKGLIPILVTVTFQHRRSDLLKDLLKVLSKAWSKVQAGEPWKRIKSQFGIVGSVSGLETTWGFANGWHPHKHILFFCRLNRIDKTRLEAVISERWRSKLGELGHYANEFIGVNVKIGNEAAGDYIAKWGLDFELAKSPVKKGRVGGYSPFQLLQLTNEGKAWSSKLFIEYAKAMKGHKQLFWSRGLRELLGLAREQTDEELANQAFEASYLFAVLTWRQYEKVLYVADRHRPGLIGELLEVAGSCDPDKFWGFLGSFGIEARPGQRELSEYPWLHPINYSGEFQASSP